MMTMHATTWQDPSDVQGYLVWSKQGWQACIVCHWSGLVKVQSQISPYGAIIVRWIVEEVDGNVQMCWWGCQQSRVSCSWSEVLQCPFVLVGHRVREVGTVLKHRKGGVSAIPMVLIGCHGCCFFLRGCIEFCMMISTCRGSGRGWFPVKCSHQLLPIDCWQLFEGV